MSKPKTPAKKPTTVFVVEEDCPYEADWVAVCKSMKSAKALAASRHMDHRGETRPWEAYDADYDDSIITNGKYRIVPVVLE